MSQQEKQKEQKPAEKQDYSGLNDLERAIHRGFLCAGVENVPVTIIKETARDCLAQQKAEWSEEDESMLWNIISIVGQCKSVQADSMLDWLKSLRPQPKQEWNEGDKEKLYQVIETLLADKEIALREYPFCKPLHEAYDDMITFLKSLSPCPSWKPSEEQMRALGDYIDGEEISECDMEEIVRLYNDLKEL